MATAADMLHPLDNIFWHALTGAQVDRAVGEGGARRYARGYSPIAAFADPARPDFDALAPHCAPGEALYLAGCTGEVPSGWRLDLEAPMLCMSWDGPSPSPSPSPLPLPVEASFVTLTAEHRDAAVALAALTRPGPFGPRTLELGEYLGAFEGDRLVAMAGERSFAPGHREISGVCTHPDFQGRGLARRLMLALIGRQLARGETPFLHVVSANARAAALYRRMGFRDHGEPRVRVVART